MEFKFKNECSRGGKTLRIAVALALMGGLYSFNAPTAAADDFYNHFNEKSRYNSGRLIVSTDNQLTENDSSRYKFSGNIWIDDFLSTVNYHTNVVGNTSSDNKGYNFSWFYLTHTSGIGVYEIKNTTSNTIGMSLTGNLYNNVTLFKVAAPDWDTRMDLNIANPDIEIKGNSSFVNDGGITFFKVDGNKFTRLNIASTRPVVYISENADLSKTTIRAYDINTNVTAKVNANSLLALGYDKSSTNGGRTHIWNNNQIKAIGL